MLEGESFDFYTNDLLLLNRISNLKQFCIDYEYQR